ncbi:DUF4232 domain-containing protein [Streptomyces sp. NPDC026672]|uniref:DUF4232 domain-containing protein n=1 Tax=unclassified Streptomyces TaxID=2593676 RepID=UPI0034029EC6
MRIRTAVAAGAVPAAVAALLLSAPQSQAAGARVAPCAEQALTVRAKADAVAPSIVRIDVTNRGGRACVVDRIPTVTFGDLDGAALPVPEGESGPYRIGAGASAYAAVRTIADPADPEARRVDTITVAADPSHFGRTFTAARLGAGDAVLVWEPVTTWWQPSRAAADRALGLS